MKKLALIAILAGTSVSVAGLAYADHHKEGGDRSKHREARAERMIERFDTDGDGAISTEEVEAMKAAKFAEADANGDGGLTMEEIEAWHEAQREKRMQARKERMFDKRDTNGDGVISIDEFEDRGMPMFERLDADEDGEITAEELAAMRGHRAMRHGGWKGRRGAPEQE